MDRSYINGLRCKGFSFSAATGQSTFKIDLSGLPGVFIGIATRGLLDTTRLTLQINNDLVIDSVAGGFFNTDDSNPRELTAFTREIKGSDDIKLITNNNGGGADAFELVVYYRNS